MGPWNCHKEVIAFHGILCNIALLTSASPSWRVSFLVLKSTLLLVSVYLFSVAGQTNVTPHFILFFSTDRWRPEPAETFEGTVVFRLLLRKMHGWERLRNLVQQPRLPALLNASGSQVSWRENSSLYSFLNRSKSLKLDLLGDALTFGFRFPDRKIISAQSRNISAQIAIFLWAPVKSRARWRTQGPFGTRQSKRGKY